MTFYASQRGALKFPGVLLVNPRIYRRLKETLMRRSAAQAVATPDAEPASTSATVRTAAGISFGSIGCFGRVTVMLALMAALLAAWSPSWSAENSWDKHMKAGQKAFGTGLGQKYLGGWGEARPTPGFTKAEGEYLAAIAAAQGLPDGDLRKAEALGALAGTYTEEGKFADAENSGNQALAIVEASVPSDDPQLGAALAHLAVIYDAESQPERATALWDRALSILKKAGSVDPRILQQLTFMASNLERHIGPAGPAQMFQAILKLSESSGASDDDLKMILLHLAWLQTGSDAEQDYTRILEIDRRLFRPDSRATGFDLQELGRLYFDEGDYAAALPALQHAAEILQKTSQPAESTRAQSFDRKALDRLNRQLAEVYRRTGKSAQAEELYTQLISHDETEIRVDRISGTRDLSSDLMGLSRVFCAAQRYAEALDNIRQAELAEAAIPEPKTQDKKLLNPTTMAPWSWDTQFARAEIYREQGNTAAAEPLYQNALDRAQGLTLPPGYPRLAELLDNYATLLRDEGRYAEAETLYKQALDTWAKNRYPEQPDVAESLTRYAALLAKLDRPAEAESLTTRASTIRAKLSRSQTAN